jgi:E3 ubiquitin-protein ligase HERC2
MGELIRVVHQTKWRLIKARQEQSRSYKEVCFRVQERCRFLLFEVRAASSAELRALDHLPLLHVQPRWPRLVRRVIADLRAKKQQPPAKPEDIVNASIQVRATRQGTLACLCCSGPVRSGLIGLCLCFAEPGRRAQERGEA